MEKMKTSAGTNSQKTANNLKPESIDGNWGVFLTIYRSANAPF